jgi:hypothetical protein
MEHDWILTLAQNERIDGIISDNRYGLWHPEIPSVILTHQLQIVSGLGQFIDNILRHLHYQYFNRFSQCWIVDAVGEPNLGGRLSHPPTCPPNSQYIGWLSQFAPLNANGMEEHLLILLSGPEPQRSMLSDLLWNEVYRMDRPIVFVEGSAAAELTQIPPHIQYFRQVDARRLQPLLESAEIVVCRSGYSSLMDLILLNKKAILIPTPGQTEQEFLAKSLSKQQIFYSEPQQGFSLKEALSTATSFPFKPLQVHGGHEVFKPILTQWLETL